MKTIICSFSILLLLVSCNSAEITDVPESRDQDSVKNEFVPVQQLDSIGNISSPVNDNERSIVGKGQKIPMH